LNYGNNSIPDFRSQMSEIRLRILAP